MSGPTIAPDGVLSRLLAVRPTQVGDLDKDEIESAFGHFEPSPDLLREAMDAVFWSSLSLEEGKAALVRVQFADGRDPQCRLGPRPLSSAALRKLSPLMDEPSNVLCIGRDATILGVGAWIGGIGVVAHRPGYLTVLDGPSVLGVFEGGAWTLIGGGEANVSSIVQRALPGDSFPDRFSQATLIVRLAMVARRNGRGATFVLLPEDDQTGIESIAYPVEAFSALPEALNAWRQATRSTPSSAVRDRNRILVGLAQAIVAAGAGIDGATLIDEASLRLLGFGAKIGAPDDSLAVQVLELPETVARAVMKKDLGGMRHQSAARLVQLNQQSAAIVVSQDGDISFFAWAREQAVVVVVKGLERYLSGHSRFER